MTVSSSFFDLSSQQATVAFAGIAKEHDVTCEVHMVNEFARLGFNMGFVLLDTQTTESLIDFDVRVMSFIDIALKALSHPARNLKVFVTQRFNTPDRKATTSEVFSSASFSKGQMGRDRATFSIFVADNSM